MAAIKSFTDLKQSKKLAEFLPTESADSSWEQYAICGDNLDVPEEMQYIHQETPFRLYSGIGVPCWSLAALLGQIPYKLFDNNGNLMYLQINKEDNGYQLVYTDPYGDVESTETNSYKDFVDVCYEMVIKLHELKLI